VPLTKKYQGTTPRMDCKATWGGFRTTSQLCQGGDQCKAAS